MSEIRRTNWPSPRGSSAKVVIPEGDSSGRLSNQGAGANGGAAADQVVGAAGPATGGSSVGNLASDAELTVISTRPPVGADIQLPAPVPTLEIGKILEGEVLGQFVLEEFIGGGGMGAVFRALDTSLNREVAVKVLSRGQSTDEETLRRFQNEAQSAARLDHENIARVYLVGEDRGVHYIVFEYIDGINLRDLVDQQGPLSLEEAIRYTVQVSEALAHSSQRDVIHRDIKPSNVLITRDAKAKLVDMGLARLHQVEHPDNDLTASGVTLGTFDYISPEQARDPRSADVRSDLYSLGCSLYFMLTGRPPFPEGTVLQKLLRHQQDEAPDPRDLRSDLPVELVRIIERLLAKNPTDRYQHPSELIAALADASAELGLPPVNAPAAVWTPKVLEPVPWNQHLPWIVPCALLVVVVIGLDYYWSRMDRASDVSLPPIRPNLRRAEAGGPGNNSAAATSQDSGTSSASATDNQPPMREPMTGRNGAAASSQTAASASGSTFTPPISIDQVSSWLSTVMERAAALRPLPKADVNETESTASANTSASEPREGLLIVSDRDEGPNSYPSLQAACAAAKSGDIIELRFNGRRDQVPIALGNKNLKIFSGVNYQPVLSFRPTEVDPARQSRSMLSVVGGQLTLVSVHLELDIPQIPSDQWSLIEVRQAELVRLEKCTLTIRNYGEQQNRYGADAAFFDIRSGVAAMADMPTTMEDLAAHIELQNVIVRGEATLVRNREMQRLRFDWENGLLATSQRLLHVSGSSTSATSGLTEVSLRHVTAMVNSGLVLATSSAGLEGALMAEIRCSDSIILAGPTAALVEQTGVLDIESSRRNLRWNGDRNFYEGFESFWRIASTLQPNQPDDLPFNAWQAYWGSTRENLPKSDAVVWERPHPSAGPYHVMVPEDFALSTKSSNNLARNGAGDGKDAGFISDALPLVPVPAMRMNLPASGGRENATNSGQSAR